MNPFDILIREHEALRAEINKIEEMTYSVSVNTTDFGFIFREFFKFWDAHERKEEGLFKILKNEGIEISIEKLNFEHGRLRGYMENIMDSIESGDESRIRIILKGICGELVDLLRAHIMAEEIILSNINLDNLSKESLEKIELIQIIPDDRLIE